jgi:CheY-like chemotaxis protein
VEDDFLLREMITLTLTGEGFRVATAANGEDAFQRLRNFERPDVILLDLMMPVMDGCRFCDQQKQDPRLAAIPVVILSAVGDIEEQARTLGARSYLQKPVEMAKLVETVRDCCA